MINQNASFEFEAYRSPLRASLEVSQTLDKPKELPGYGVAMQTVLLGFRVYQDSIDAADKRVGEIWVEAHETTALRFELNCCNVWTTYWDWSASFRDPAVLGDFFDWLGTVYQVTPKLELLNLPWDLL